MFLSRLCAAGAFSRNKYALGHHNSAKTQEWPGTVITFLDRVLGRSKSENGRQKCSNSPEIETEYRQTAQENKAPESLRSLSARRVVYTTLEQTLTASDGNEYLVTVTYDNTSGIPSDAELSVLEIKEGEAGYEEYVAQSAAALGEKPENLAFARPFDITLKNPETGEEYQPNEAVQVSIKLLKDDLNGYASVDVIHIPDGAGEEAQVMDTTVHGESVEFETDGFSVYVLCGYTVDFYWGDYTYSIAGEDSITLSALFEKLGVSEIAVSDVTGVSFSNPEYIEIEQTENDWLLRSLAPFDTEEALVLTLKNGKSVEIRVTDERVASGTCGDNTQWTLDDAGTLTISLVDPSIGTGTVTSRPWEAPYKADITEITMDDGITSLPNDAFKACSNVTTIRFPSTLTTIPKNACSGLKNLTTVNFSELTALESIGDDGFNGCTALNSPVNLSSAPNFNKLGACTFKDCSSIPRVVFSGTQFNFQATSNQQMFYNCTSLVEVVLPETVTGIYNEAFRKCSNLERVNFSALSSLQTIGNFAFADCKKLTGEGFENLSALQSIGNDAFNACSALSIELDSSKLASLQTLGTAAFKNSGVTKADLSGLPLTQINNQTFNNCASLEEVVLPTNIAKIGTDAFRGCKSLSAVNLDELKNLTEIGNYAFADIAHQKVDLSGNEELTAIGSGTFTANKRLTEVDLSGCSSLTSIADSLFKNCERLSTVDCSGCTSLTSISNSAFNGNCYNITSVDLSGCTNLTAIGTAFNNSKKIVTLDLSGTALSDLNAFSECKDSLEELRLTQCANMTTVDVSAYTKLKTLYLPNGVTSLTLSSVTTIYFDGTNQEWDDKGLPRPEGVTIIPRQEVYIKADDVEKVYGAADRLTASMYDNETHKKIEGVEFKYQLSRDPGENAGKYTITPTGPEKQGNYTVVRYETGTLTIKPAPVTLTAVSGYEVYDGTEKHIEGFTASVEGLTFDGVRAASTASKEVGHYPVTFEGVSLDGENRTYDTTGNYYVDRTQNGEFIITKLLEKSIFGIDGNRVTYRLVVNPDGLTLNGQEPITLRDTLKSNGGSAASNITNQSIDYGTIRIQPANAGTSYDYSGATGTYIFPDAKTFTITYTTRVLGEAGVECTFSNDAVLLDSEGEIASDSTTQTQMIYPTASDVESDSCMVKLLVYGDADMDNRLSGAKFVLLDANQRPVVSADGSAIAPFVTDANGEAEIRLDPRTDGISIEKNTVYYLDMIQAPEGYRKDNTLYNFMITDDASYNSGDIYTYFNGDTMKVRLRAEQPGLNVAVRFAGNHELTEEQQDGIEVVLEKWNGSVWEEMERHAYSQFRAGYGALTFDAGGADAPFEEGFYRVTEENQRPWDLEETINTSAVYSLAVGAEPVVEDSEPLEFEVTSDNRDKSFNLVITNQYIEHKLTITKMDKQTGDKLPGAEFAVKKASDDTVVKTYTTDSDGMLVISGGEGFESETLYYVEETNQPEGYLLPLEPERTYFYFCNDDYMIREIEAGLPEGKTAINLSSPDGFDSLTLDNQKEYITVPVMVTWQGNIWPSAVETVTIGLYRSTDGGATREPVLDENNNPRTVDLYPGAPYDNRAFTNLPAREGESEITYSIVEEGINGDALLDSYVKEYGVSDSGIYIAYNKEATTLTVENVWVDEQGEPIGEEPLSEPPEVTFDVYRSTQKLSDLIQPAADGSFTNEKIMELIDSRALVKVRESEGFEAQSNSTVTDNLDKGYYSGSAFLPYYYYVLETVPSFGDETYLADEANGKVTIRNVVAPETVSLKVTKEIKDDPREESAETEFDFTLSLTKGAHVIRNYQVLEEGENSLTTDWDGKVSFALKPEQTVVLKLPVGVTATVEEDENREYTTATTAKNNVGAVADQDENGRVFKYAVDKETGDVTVTFTNTLHVICKVVDSSGTHHPFESLKSALAYIHANPDQALDGDGVATIQMLEDYDVPAKDAFEVRENDKIVLTTASADDEKFPFEGEEGADTAVITRAEDGGSLLVNAGTLTLDRITLDGAKDSHTATGNGGLIYNTGVLSVNTGTTLRNSKADGMGGAIYNEGAATILGGTVSGNIAENGSAIYIAEGELNIHGGAIEGNDGASDGAVANTNTGVKINLSGNPRITGNVNADGEDANLYIGANSGSVINVVGEGLGPNARIGVRATANHREIGDMFALAAFDVTNNLDRFINDEYGYKGKLRDGSHTNIVWNGLTLNVLKRYAGQGVDTRDTFTITISSASIRKTNFTINGTLDYTITPAKGNRPGTIVLNNVALEKDLTVFPLPVGSYTVSEADSNYETTYSYRLTDGADSGETVLEDGSFQFENDITLTITDRRRLATVNLVKTLADRLMGDDETVDFPFTVKLQEADGTPIDGFTLMDEITTQNGAALIVMSPSNTAEHTRPLSVPVGATMTITEAANDAYRISASAVTVPSDEEGTAGTIIEDLDTGDDHVFAFAVTDDNAQVTFENERKMAHIEVSMSLLNKAGAPEPWNLIVNLTREDGEPAANYLLYEDEQNPENNLVTDANGKKVITFNFDKGVDYQSIVLDIPEGTRLDVEEAAANKTLEGYYDLAVPANGSAPNTGYGFVFEPVKETDHSIAFTNTRRTYTVTVSNTVSGYSGNVLPFTFTATLSDEGEGIERDYTDGDFTDGEVSFELATGQSRTLTVPEGAVLNVTETFVVGYDTTVKRGSNAADTSRSIEFKVQGDETLAFTNSQLIGMQLVNKTSSTLENVTVTVGWGDNIFLVNDDRTDQENVSKNKKVTLSIEPGKTVLLEIQHQASVTYSQDYTVKGTMSADGYYYTINNEPSYHEFADPAIMRVYDKGNYEVKGKLRYSTADSTITFTAQPLVSFDVNGGAWTTEMEGYNDRNGDRQVYQIAVTSGEKVAKPDPAPVYPTEENITFLGWTEDYEYANLDHATGEVDQSKLFDFTAPVYEPKTLFAIWSRPARETHVVTVKNATANDLTVQVTRNDETTENITLNAGTSHNLEEIPDQAKLVLATGASVLAVSDQFTDGDNQSGSFTIGSVTRDGTVTFAPGICKITDGTGNILYDANGQPAVFMKLSDAFTAYDGTLYTTAEHNIVATQAAVKMLVDKYTISSKHAFPTKDMILTTAGKDDANFPYVGVRDRATLYRDAAFVNDCLFTLETSGREVTLTDIILDGGSEQNIKTSKNKNGGLIYINHASGVLNIETGTTLRNCAFAAYDDSNNSRGGAIYIKAGTLNVKGGLFSNLHARRGGAICVEESATLNLTGSNGSTKFEHCDSSNDGGGGIYYGANRNLVINGGTNKDNPGIIFVGCKALTTSGNGGAIFVKPSTTNTYSAEISGCSFTECSARIDNGNDDSGNGGGAINALQTNGLTVSYCSFSECDSMKCGGAVIAKVKNVSTVSINSCSFERCNSRAQGGGVAAYQNSNSESKTWLRIHDSTFANCSAGTAAGSGGAVQSYIPCLEFEDSTFSDCWAGREGGGVNGFYAGVGTTWKTSETHITGCRFIRCRAEDRNEPTGDVHYGGGLNSKGYAVTVKDSYFEACVSTLKQGGALHFWGTGDDSYVQVDNSRFLNCQAKGYGGAIQVSNDKLEVTQSEFYGCSSFASYGGAISHNRSVRGDWNLQNKTTITGCTFSADPDNENSVSCSASQNGGAIWTRAKEVTIENCTIDGSTAGGNGGAVYLDRKSDQPNTNATLSGNTIRECIADGNGGGVYVNYGANTTSVVLEDNTITANRATYGSAVFATNNSRVTFKQSEESVERGVGITGNIATHINGGAVSVGGNGAKIYFEGHIRVKDNTCSEDAVYNHNVALNHDSFGIINTTQNGLKDKAYIGVYATNASNVYTKHGKETQDFGTYPLQSQGHEFIEAFVNDRDEDLTGYQLSESDSKIYWGRYLCKITDAEGNTLTRTNGRDAVYQKLTAALDDFSKLEGEPVYIKMLVENYSVFQKETITNFPAMAVTLTTASKDEPDGKHPYMGADDTVCTINRSTSYTDNKEMFGVSNADTVFTLENITLDGRKNNTATQGSYRLIHATSGSIIIGGGSTLKYGRVTGGNDLGGAIYAEANASVQVNSKLDANILFDHCVGKYGGGAIGAQCSVKITCQSAEDGTRSVTTFDNCTADRGGAVYIGNNSDNVYMNVSGATFTNCHSVNEGGALFHNNTSNQTTAYLTVRNSVFTDCYAAGNKQYSYGGAVCNKSSTLTVDSCRFEGCYAQSNGGAINHGAQNENRVQTTITNSTFDGSRTTGTDGSYGYGGSVYTQAKSVEITDCDFTGSTSYNHGGALYMQSNASGSVATIYGARFENCAVTRSTGRGGAICSRIKQLDLKDSESRATTISGCYTAINNANGFSGAVHMDTDDNGGNKSLVLNISGNTKITGCYANQGASIYLKEGVTMKLSDSVEFSRNGFISQNGRIYSSRTGANIYLAQNSRLNLEGRLKFDRNIIYTENESEKVTNGGVKDYKRQDIFLAGYGSADATSIHVAGELNGDTIWVWPEQARHQKHGNQFATTEDTVSTSTLGIFRNALDDSVTSCFNTEHLAGVRLPGQSVTNVFWDRMYQISFQKVDSKGVQVPDAEFRLYYDLACSNQVDGAVAVSSGREQDMGLVDFPAIPIGVYYMKETRQPDSYKPNPTVYLLLVGTPSLNPNDENRDLWNNGPLAVSNAVTLVEQYTVNSGMNYGLFALDGNNKAILNANLASESEGVVNYSNDYAAYFMKKDGDGKSLPGASFVIYAAEAVDGEGNPTLDENGYPMLDIWSPDGSYYPEAAVSADGTSQFRDLEGKQLDKGLVYISELLLGTYYLKEQDYPDRNGSNRKTYFVENDRVFRLEIKSEDNFTLSEWKGGTTYEPCASDGKYYIIQNTEAVCKLTDSKDNLLYELGRDGEARPAIYATLEEGFAAAQYHTFVNAQGKPVSVEVGLKLKVLKDCTFNAPVTYAGTRPLTLTTAERSNGKDRYLFTTTRTSDVSRAEIRCADGDDALITLAEGANLTLQNINLNGRSTYSQRAIHVMNGQVAIETNTLIQKFKGGALLMEEGTGLDVNGGAYRSAVFRSNETAADGGAICATGNCTISISNAQFSFNQAANGGAISIQGAAAEGLTTDDAVTLNNVVFRSNSATQNGGAVYANNGVSLLLSGVTVSNNTAPNGGGVYAEAGLAMASGTVSNNTAQDNGGAFWVGGELTMNGGILSGNKAVNGNGGAVYAEADASASMSGGSITNNSAFGNGGAVYAEAGASVTMSGGSVTGNRAQLGAAMYLDDGAFLTMSGGSIAGNTASDNDGGAINVGGADARLNFSGNPVIYNNPNGNANTQQKNVVLSEKSNDIINIDDGGMSADAKIGVYTTEAVRGGHGVAGMPFGSFPTGNVANLDVFINDVADAFGHPFGTTGAEEGTLYWRDYIARVVEANGKETFFEYLCDTTEQGLNKQGAFDFANEKNGNVVIETLLQAHNRYTLPSAVTFGKERAVTLRTTQEKKYNPDGFVTTITRGAEYDANSMFTVGAGSLTIDHITLDGDKNNCTNVSADGGIVSVTSGSLTLGDGATLQNSETTGNGGAVYLASGTSMTMNGGEIAGNASTNVNETSDEVRVGGGGVFVDQNAAFNMTGGSVHGNDAAVKGNFDYQPAGGGGIFVAKGSTMTMTGGTIYGNSTAGKGGGIFSESATLTIGADAVIGDESNPNNAEYGGGIAIYSRRNYGSLSTLTFDGAKVIYNKANSKGGGIYIGLNIVNVTIKGATLSHNEVTASNGNGGGLYIEAGSSSLVQVQNATTISENKASYGGGFYVSCADANKVVFDNVQITGNTATSGGGGYANNLTLRNGVQIRQNKITTTDIKNGAGLYVTAKLKLGQSGGAEETTRIEGNYTLKTVNGNQVKDRDSNLRLPWLDSKDTGTNKQNAYKINGVLNNNCVELLCPFIGKLLVSNPGDALTQFGVSGSRDYLADPEGLDTERLATLIDRAYIVSDDETDMIGRIDWDGQNSLKLRWYKKFICKITDGNGTLLYKADGTPALYTKLYPYNAGLIVSKDDGAAISMLNNDIPQLFYREELTKDNPTPYQTKDSEGYVVYQVKMLDDYTIRDQMFFATQEGFKKKITLTTAETTGDYPYIGKNRNSSKPYAEIDRGESFRYGAQKNNPYFIRLREYSYLTLANITMDGGSLTGMVTDIDGPFVNLFDKATLIIDDGTTLQNAESNIDGDKDYWGGGAVCHGSFSQSGTTIIMKGGVIKNCHTNKNGGAIGAMNGGNITVIAGGTIEYCRADGVYELSTEARRCGGGAIYLGGSQCKLYILGGTIKNCTAPNGGAIFLDGGWSNGGWNNGFYNSSNQIMIGGDSYVDHAGKTVSLAAEKDNAIVFKDNYATAVYNWETKSPADGVSYIGKRNGMDSAADASGRIRQDIYFPCLSDTTNRSPLIVTGEINAEQGSIRVWANNPYNTDFKNSDHYKDGEQFAKFAKVDGSTPDYLVQDNGKLVGMTLTPSELAACNDDEKLIKEKQEEKLKKTLRVFRNALENDVVKTGTTYSYDTYLTGCEGALANCIYWGPIINGFNVVFLKIDGFGNRLDGAGFKLYKDADCSILLREEESVSATDETTAEAGIVTFARVPNGIYYMQETTVPDGYANANTYIVLVGTGALTPNDTDDVWQEGGVLADIDQAAIEAQTGTGADALKFAIFQIDSATGKATALPDIAGHGVMNASKQARKVVLRKVDLADYAALENARFRIFRADMSEITEGQPTFTEGVNAGKPKGYYESLASGAFYIGQLPYGLYYIEETQLPSASYEPVTHYFVFKVDADGFWAEPADGTTPGVVTWKRTNILAQSGRDADALPTGD